MKLFLTITVILLASNLLAQFDSSKKIELKGKNLISDVNAVTDDTANNALKVASYFFNSKEFQDSILKLNFPYRNHCIGCGKGKRSSATINGQVILDSIFRKSEVYLTLRLLPVGKTPINTFRKKHCWGLGNTCPDTDSITSFYQNINCDMGDDLPFTYAYAVHLSHEYMHNVGFCHTNHELTDDIAEAVGWIAFYYIKKWYDEGRIKLK